MHARLASWLAGWLTGWLDGWLSAGWLAGWLVDWLAGWLGCLAGWLAGWLADWLAGWLAGYVFQFMQLLCKMHRVVTIQVDSLSMLQISLTCNAAPFLLNVPHGYDIMCNCQWPVAHIREQSLHRIDTKKV